MTAFLFPGQGAQVVGMGKDFADAFEVARLTFQEADDLLSEHLSRIIFEGPEELLTKTNKSQPAIFVTSVAILRVLQEQLPSLEPTVTAGLSLGEYTALFASKRLGFKETLLLVKKRAELMNEACELQAGAMAAVLGLSATDVESALKGLEGVWVANYNCPNQTVISGTKKGVEAGTLALQARGARRVLPLTVHGAFHSPLMQRAEEGLTPFIQEVSLLESPIAMVMNVPGDFVTFSTDIRSHLAAQVTQSVRWEQGIQALEKRGIEQYIEIGCGKTLAGMNKKIGTKAPTISVEKLSDLETVGAYALAKR